MEYVVGELNRFGIGRQDCVAIALTNGPELAASFLTISAAAACAPLNPAYRESEFTFYLKDLNAKALLVERDVATPARAAAAALNVPIIQLTRETEREAGIFSLTGHDRPAPAAQGFAEAGDCALVLHTSGTTSRAKRVPLTQGNVCAAAHNVCCSLELTRADRCLNVMPLFHIHGLVTAVLASLFAGGSVICPDSFEVAQFLTWLSAFRPTWYTAVPTIHHAVVAQASQSGQDFTGSGLRLIRSTSAPLPPRLLAELEDVFGVPVLESYGLTEASHVCCNPLPPKARKPGSVGLPVGAAVAIIDEAGRLLGPGEVGEIVVRGPNVISAYAGEPSANESPFTNDWFRTGDQGFRDQEGYFYVTGRIKEMINRGGEKITPREVDETLLAHPSVVQAVTFAVPHARLGQDVAAAVVLRNGDPISSRDLLQFARERLAPSKVPSQVIIVDRIPKTAIGKFQRISMYKSLVHLLRPEFVAPAGPTEEALARIWCDLLGLDRVGVHENFFYLGGDSLLAVRLVAQIEKILGKSLPLVRLFNEPTIAELAKAIREPIANTRARVVELQPRGSKPPLVFLPSLVGDIWYPRAIVEHLAPDQPVYGIQPSQHDKAFAPLEAIAEGYIDALRGFQSRGPYHLAGYSFAGLLAYEMAQQLTSRREQVVFLTLIDTSPRPLTRHTRIRAFFRNAFFWLMDDLLQTPPKETVARLHRHAAAAQKNGGFLFRSIPSSQVELEHLFPVAHLPPSYRQAMENNLRASREYVCKPYAGRVTLLRARTRPLFRPLEADLGWSSLAVGGVDLHVIPGHHGSMLRPPHVRHIAEHLQAALDRTVAELPPTRQGQACACCHDKS